MDTKVSSAHCGQCGLVCRGNCKAGQCLLCKKSSDCRVGQACRKGNCITCPGDPDCDQLFFLAHAMEGVHFSLDSAGNMYVAGVFGNSLRVASTVLTSQGKGDVFFGKLDPQGNWLWAHGIGGPGQEAFPQIHADTKGNVYLSTHYGRDSNGKPLQVLYNTRNPKTLQVPNGRAGAMLFSSFDKDGAFRWAFPIFGGTYHWGTHSTVLPSGDSWVSLTAQETESVKGVFCGIDNMHNGVDPLDNDGQMALVSVNAEGKCKWGRVAGSSEHDSSQAVVVDAKKNIYWGGVSVGSASFGSFSTQAYGKEDIVVSKLSPEGKFLWAYSFGGPGNDFLQGLQVDANENVYIHGLFQESVVMGTTTLKSEGKSDGFVTLLNQKGVPVWSLHCRSSEDSGIYNSVIGPKGFLYVTGSFKGTVQCGTLSFSSSSNSVQDGFVLKIHPDTGEILWSATFKGDGYEFLAQVRLGANGVLYVLAGSNSTTFFADDKAIANQDPAGSLFMWLLKP